MKRNPLVDTLLGMETPKRLRALRALSDEEKKEIRHFWPAWARDEQLPPAGPDWRLWLILAGRGFGKTRAGAEWIRHVAEKTPEARIALVAANLGEARAVMVEGESGLIERASPGRVPQFEPSLKRLTWPNGAQALLYSAGEPESLRGPQHSHACRAGPEGSLRQRNRRPPRCAGPSGHRERAARSARHAGRRSGLADRHRRKRRVGGPHRADRRASRRELAVLCRTRRTSCAQPRDRTGPALSQWLDRGGQAGSPERRHNHRCRSPRNACTDPHRAIVRRDNCVITLDCSRRHQAFGETGANPVRFAAFRES